MTFEDFYDAYRQRVIEWLDRNASIIEERNNQPRVENPNINIIRLGKDKDSPLPKIHNIYKDLPENTIDIITKLVMVKAGVWRKEHCGSFINSYLSNDLRATLAAADQDSAKHLKVIHMGYLNIQYYDLPKEWITPEFAESTQDE